VPILVSCTCGKKLRVKDESAGKRVRCPGCDGVVPVPPSRPKEVEAANPQGESASPGGGDQEPFFWVDSTGFGTEMIALSDDALHLASLGGTELKEAMAALSQGTSVQKVLTKPKLLVPFEQMRKVSSNLHLRSVDIFWKEPSVKDEKDKNLILADKQSRDELLEGLRQRLGQGWKRRVREFTRLRAAWAPLAVIGFFGAIAVCVVLANLYPDPNPSTGPRRIPWFVKIFFWLNDIIGWVGVTIVFASFALIGVIWFVMRMLKPPLMVTLTP
jgi:DNA-directed RNA polymerase subunit RPC12/RpoP